MKKNINEFMPYVLPVATIFFLIVFFISSPAAISQATSITGFFAREPSYALAGKLEITEYEYQERNCSIDLEVLSEDITINRTISRELLEKSRKK